MAAIAASAFILCKLGWFESRSLSSLTKVEELGGVVDRNDRSASEEPTGSQQGRRPRLKLEDSLPAGAQVRAGDQSGSIIVSLQTGLVIEAGSYSVTESGVSFRAPFRAKFQDGALLSSSDENGVVLLSKEGYFKFAQSVTYEASKE
jgi:hypothetical protein